MIDIKKDFPKTYEEFIADISFNASNHLFSYDHILENHGSSGHARALKYARDFDKVFSDAIHSAGSDIDFDCNEEMDAYFDEHPEIDPDVDYEEVYDAVQSALVELAYDNEKIKETVQNHIDYFIATRLDERLEYSNATIAIKDNKITILESCDEKDPDALSIVESSYYMEHYKKTVLECENRYQARGIFTFIKQENLLCRSVEEYAEAMAERSVADDVLDNDTFANNTSEYVGPSYDDDLDR